MNPFTRVSNWNKLPAQIKIALVEVKRERKALFPDKDYELFQRQGRERARRIKMHTTKILEMRRL